MLKGQHWLGYIVFKQFTFQSGVVNFNMHCCIYDIMVRVVHFKVFSLFLFQSPNSATKKCFIKNSSFIYLFILPFFGM